MSLSNKILSFFFLSNVIRNDIENKYIIDTIDLIILLILSI